MMASTPNGVSVTADLLPPADQQFRVRDAGWLLLQVVWMCLLAVPAIIVRLLRAIFPPTGKSLAGQVVIVTGSGRGLGKELALRFAKEGSKVAVVDFNERTARETADEIVRLGGIAKAYRANVAKPEDLAAVHAAVVGDLGAVDVVVNNAGLLHQDPIEEADERAVTGLVAVNLLSHIWAAREFLPAMKGRNAGHIVAIGSMSALQGCANIAVYAATKFGLRGFMDSMRDELEQRQDNNIKTTIVLPYFIDTSESYTRHLNVRLPPMKTEDVVDAIMIGIKREEVTVPVPTLLYFGVQLLWIMPLCIRDMARRIFYVKISPCTREEKACIFEPVVKDIAPVTKSQTI